MWILIYGLSPYSSQRTFSAVCVMFPKDCGGSSDFWKSKTLPLLLSSTDPTDSHSLPSWQVPLAVVPEILSCFSLSKLLFLELDHQLVLSLVLCFGILLFFTSRSSEMCLA